MMLRNVRVVLFDAVGTLIHPAPPVPEAYFTAGKRFGSALTLAEISQRFADAFAAENHADRLEPGVDAAPGTLHSFACRTTDEHRERLRWQRIVSRVFHDVLDADGGLFESLWQHFADSAHWRLYHDVQSAWQELERRNLTLGIASNFDRRLECICRHLAPLSRSRHVFCSAVVGYPKPSPEFFQAIEQHLAVDGSQILLVGDDHQNDYLGAKAAGWQAVLLDRHADSPAGGILSSLSQLPHALAGR
jgi:putative hydrolase of the HAD superfamily